MREQAKFTGVRKPKPTYDYLVTQMLDVHDGDSYILRVQKEIPDMGFYCYPKFEFVGPFRLYNIDTVELKTEHGPDAQVAAQQWIEETIASGGLRGTTHMEQTFGRFLIDLYDTKTGVHLADFLRDSGYDKEDSKWGSER